MHGTFEILSARLARLIIAEPAGRLGLVVDRRQQRYSVGILDAPRYRLTQPFSPDDGWRIELAPNGALVDALLDMLPAGSYFVVRSPRRPIDAPKILLGNEWVEPQANLRVLHDDSPVYALVVGAERDAPPALNQPLLGIPILNYVGESWMHGVWFLQLAASVTPDPGGDLVLIIPTTGELVLDNLGFLVPDDEARVRWRDSEAEAFARWCADLVE
jgi:hypothetical protein